MDYLQASKHFDLTKTLTSLKGKSISEIAVFLFHEGRSAEARAIPDDNPASKMQANYVFALGQLHHAFLRKEAIRLSPSYGANRAYRELVADLIDRGKLSADTLNQLK